MKKELLEIFKRNKRLTFQEVCIKLHANKRKDKYRVIDALDHLIKNGDIVLVGDYFGRAENFKLYEGYIIIKEQGYGFFVCEELEEDVFIPRDLTLNSFTNDRVLVGIYERYFRGKKVTEGAVCRILERKFTQIVGTFDGKRIINDDKKNSVLAIVPKGKSNNAVKGHKVVGKIISYNHDSVSCEIVKILGHENDPKMDIISHIYRYDIPLEFPKAVIDEANSLSDVIDVTNRLDLRDLLTITIDGDDAKDLDDAISLDYSENGYRLYVHIADVSHYVTFESELDKEAYNRGTSVYLANTVVPMLPHILCNGICSLNPNVDRYTLTMIIDLDLKGNVKNTKLASSVINSNYRMTYKNVYKLLNGEVLHEYDEIVDLVFKMRDLAKILKHKRVINGSIEFTSIESKIICDSDGTCIDVVPRESGISEGIIEEFMLIANVCVARMAKSLDVPFIYRIHEDPFTEKLDNMLTILSGLGYRIKKRAEDVTQHDIQKVLKMIPEDKILPISNIMLRSMMKAKYSKYPLGHYGLAFSDYTHFTSPIRRYPDLIVHRLLKMYVINNDFSHTKYYNRVMDDIALRCSNTEKRAMECERDVVKMKQAEFMSKHIDEVYEGHIVSFTKFGLYVMLDSSIEGMISISSLRGQYDFNEALMMITSRSGKSFRIGDKLLVRVARASKELGEIDFILEGETYEDNCTE